MIIHFVILLTTGWCRKAFDEKLFCRVQCQLHACPRNTGQTLRLDAMTTSAAVLFRSTAVVLAAGLGLAACSSDVYENQPGGTADEEASAPEAPPATAEETALAETLEEDLEVSAAMTLEDQWPDITSLAAALSGTEEPDQCQEAGAAQYNLIVDAQPPNVRASVDESALLDENATGETVFAFYANDQASADQLQEAHENTDTACLEEDSSQVDHDVTQQDVNGQQVDVHTWQIAVSGQLTGRVIDVVGDDIFVRYSAAYPPQVMVEDLEGDVADFNEPATERAITAYEAAAAQ